MDMDCAGAGGIYGVTDFLLSNSSQAASWLRQADRYMQLYNEDPERFVLPRQHAFLKPLLEAYAHNLEGFVQYLAGVKNSLPRDSLGFGRVQKLYRTVMGRYVQQVRRQRMDRAIAKAEELFGETDFHARLQWAASLENVWALRRREFLSEKRARTKENRLSAERQAELLSVFWDQIETEISEGKVPPWNWIKPGATPP